MVIMPLNSLQMKKDPGVAQGKGDNRWLFSDSLERMRGQTSQTGPGVRFGNTSS